MKIFDPKRHLPLGWEWEVTRNYLIWGHILSSLTTLIFLDRYVDALDALYIWVEGPDGTMVRELAPNRTIAPFWSLMAGMPYMGLGIFALAAAMQVWRYYNWHTQGAMSVYTMRRLPDRFELHRRCWTQPVLSVAMEILIFAGLTVLYWLLWRFATPAACLPSYL